MQSKRIRQGGFTFIEITATIGLLGILVAGMASVYQVASASGTAIDKRNQITGLVGNVRLALSGESECTQNLQGTPLAIPAQAGAPVAPATIALIQSFNGGTPSGTIAASGASRPDNLIVSSIQLQGVAPLNANVALANLAVTVQRPAVGAGPTTITRNVPLSVTMQGGTIYSCSALAESDDFYNYFMCDVNYGGLSNYDPISGQCVPNDMFVVSGTAGFVQCPAGSEVVSNDPWANCWANFPDNFNFSAPTTTRSYVNGAIDTSGPSEYNPTLSADQTSCSLIYAAGDSLTGVTSTLQCVPL